MRYKEYKDIHEGIYSGTLSCGMRVFVIPKKAYNKNQAMIAVKYGGTDIKFKYDGKWTETPAGTAHFMEHKMFDKEGKDAMRIFSSRGAVANAYTGDDITAYYFESQDMFEENLQTLLDIVSKPYFSEESVEKEKGIIKQEIGMVQDSPDFRVYVNLMNALYKNHPCRMSIAGTLDSIEKITPEILYKCYDAFYTADNMVLCVVGNADPDTVFNIAESTMKTRKKLLSQRYYGKDEKEFPKQMLITEEMEVSEPVFLAGAKVKMPEKGEEHVKMVMVADVALEILFGRSSPLYLKSYEEGIINDSITFDLCLNSNTAHIEFGGEGKDPKKFIKNFYEYAYELMYSGISSDIVKNVKKNILGNMLRNLDSFDDLCDEQVRGEFRGYCPFDFFNVLNTVTGEDVREFIEENLCQEKVALSIIKQKNKKPEESV